MRNILAIFYLLISIVANSQDKKVDVKTKMDNFTSRAGVITKIIDYKLDRLKSIYGNHVCRVRKIIANPTSVYFLQIINQGKYNSSTASIEYSDLLEIIKAISSLKTELVKDLNSINYIENKFTSIDGFEVGYNIEDNKATWFLKLEKYGNENFIFIDDSVQIENILSSAKNKVEELKKM